MLPGTPTTLRRAASAVLILVCGWFGLASAQQPGAPIAKPPKPAARPARSALVKGVTVEGITEYSLPNGLKVLLFPDPSKPTTTVNITYLVGSRYEGYGETGMAHLLEHMVFKGTPKHRNIPQELTEHGANPNGTTWFDRTNYFETFSATDPNLTWALDLEADRMVNSLIAKKDLETEFTVVRNEFEAGENDPGEILEERVMSTAFLWHNYGHSTIGARSDIEQVPIERLQAFYHKYYEPDNAILVVAGRFDEPHTLQLIEQKFGRIPRPRRTGIMLIYPTYTAEPTQDGERSVTLRRVGDVQVITAAYHVPAGSHEDFPAVDVLAGVLGDAPSGRLYTALVETRKAASVSAFDYKLREPGVLIASAEVRKEASIDSARIALLAALDEVVRRPPTEAEVARAKATLLKNIELLLNSSERVGLNLSEWASMGDWRMLFLFRDRLKQVTAADVQRVAATYLKPSNLTLGTFIPTEKPDRAEIPPAPDVAMLVKDYRGDTTLAQGEAFDASPANIDRRTTFTALSGGLKLALLPKQTRGQSVRASLNLHFGSLAAAMNRSAVADLTGDMLLRGTRSLTRQQIKDSLDKLKARVNLFGRSTQVGVRIETTRPYLPAVLRLVGQVLREPAFDPKEFEELKQENLASLEPQRSDPQALAFTAYQRYLNPFPKGDPRYTPTVDEQVADYTAASLDEVRKFYAELYGASDGQLAVVGDFDSAEILALAGELLDGWRSPQKFERIPTEYRSVAATSISIETPDKANAMFLAGQNLDLRDDDPDYPALLLANEMLGGGFLNSRLATRIRQKEGVSYGVGSFINAPSLDRNGQWGTYAIYAPENAERLESAFREEIDRALKDGFTSEEVEKAKAGYLQNQQVGRSQDGSLAGSLAENLYLNRTLAFDAQFEKKLSTLTVDEINQALRHYLVPSQITVVKAGDFAKKAGQPAKP